MRVTENNTILAGSFSILKKTPHKCSLQVNSLRSIGKRLTSDTQFKFNDLDIHLVRGNGVVESSMSERKRGKKKKKKKKYK